jgi:deazaflavin-dependent oxidoreductase (nitroreductase family)
MNLPSWLANIIALPRVSRVALAVATAIDRPLMRASRGRLRLSFIIPLLLLRCPGARSGVQREVPLLYVTDGDDVLLVASNGGREREPAWAHNLRACARNSCPVTCLVDGLDTPFVVAELAAQARREAWALAVRVYPGYERYAVRVAREIAVFRLVRLDGVAPRWAHAVQ